MFAVSLFNDALSKTPLDEKQRCIYSSLSRSIHSLGTFSTRFSTSRNSMPKRFTPKSKLIDVHDLFSGIEAEFATVAYAKALRFKLLFPMGNVALVSDGHCSRAC